MIVREGQIWRKISDVKDYLNLDSLDNDTDYQVVEDTLDDLGILMKPLNGKEAKRYSLGYIEDNFIYIFTPEDYKEDNHEFSDILNSIGKMLAEKDKRYGNSALKPLDIFAKHHSYGARLDEKLARVKHSDELRKNDVADIIGGLVLICRGNGWIDFSDQID